MANFHQYTDVPADDHRSGSLYFLGFILLYMALLGLVIWVGAPCSKDGWQLLDRCVPNSIPPS
jgi:hypothetical protein